MKLTSQFFFDAKHPEDVSDFYHILNESNILHVVYWRHLFDVVGRVSGDIVECGVGRGRSLIILCILNRFFSSADSNYPKRKIFGLDSFEGFPEPKIEDTSFREKHAGEWSHSPNKHFKYSRDNITKVLRKGGVDDEQEFDFTLVEGFFETTTKDLVVDDIAILHLDGDLYSSIKEPLLNLSKKVVKGGIIVIDDYVLNANQDAWPGARKAVEEFLECNNEFELEISLKGSPFLRKI